MTTKAATKPQAKRGRPITRVSTVLTNARDILANGRWTRGCLKRTNGAHCAEGAIYEALGAKWVRRTDGSGEYDLVPNSFNYKLFDQAHGYLGVACETTPYKFNDGMTKKKVIAKFDTAIKTARSDERKATAQRITASSVNA